MEDLERFARKQEDHRRGWQHYMTELQSSGAIGVCFTVPIACLHANSKTLCMQIWHEMYVVQPGAYETIYGSMPPHLLGAVPTHGVHATHNAAGPVRVEVVKVDSTLASSSRRMKASADYK